MVDNEKELTHIDLFSGIGGFTLAAEWAGFRTVVFCEKEKFCQKILKKRFGAITYTDNGRQPRNLRETVSRREDKTIPNSELGSRNSGRSSIYRPTLIPEIRDLDGTKYRGATLLTGGFPCQPFSVAGQRRGKEDDRYLWPQMRRVISEAKPCWILAENVPGIFRMALDTVLADLEGEGYTVGTFIIPACGLNAPHRRNRVWIVANSEGFRPKCSESSSDGKGGILSTKGTNCNAQDAIGTRTRNQDRKIDDQKRRESQDRREGIRQEDGTISSGGTPSANKHASNSKRNGWAINQGISSQNPNDMEEHFKLALEDINYSCWQEDWYEVAARFCRVDDGVPNRVHRLKALGNAIIPQIAYEILKNIAWIENELAR